MKKYYTTLVELNIAKSRLVTLEERKDLFMTLATKTTSSIVENASFGSGNSDKVSNYIIKIDKIDKEINQLKKEIKILQKGLNQMDVYLNDMKCDDIEKKVFVLYYKKNKRPEEIANLLPCGIATVYRKLRHINKVLDNDNNW